MYIIFVVVFEDIRNTKTDVWIQFSGHGNEMPSKGLVDQNA